MPKSLVAMLVLVLVTNAIATQRQNYRWKYVGSNKKVRIYFDPTKIQQLEKQVRRAWVKEVPVSNVTRQQIVKDLSYLKEDVTRFAYSLNLQDHDCLNNRARLVEAIYYDSTNAVIKSIDLAESEDSKWIAVVPDSTGEQTQQAICQAKLDHQQ